MRQYATAADLAAFPGGDAIPAARADSVLRAASRVVDRLLTGYRYTTDKATGLPTDTLVGTVLRDAVCAIAVECAESGMLDPGATFEWASASIGSVSLSGRTTATGATIVDGLPVPALTLADLASVGEFEVNTL
jgi:hypothetical protein